VYQPDNWQVIDPSDPRGPQLIVAWPSMPAATPLPDLIRH